MRPIIAIVLVALLAPAAGACLSQADELSSGRDPFVRSFFWPGLGQIEQDRPGVGAAFAGGAILTALAVFKAQTDYHSAAKDFRNASDAYANAIEAGDTDSAWYFFQQLDDFNGKADRRYDDRKLWIMGLGAVWVANLADVWWHERGGSDRVALSPVPRSGGGGLAVILTF